MDGVGKMTIAVLSKTVIYRQFSTMVVKWQLSGITMQIYTLNRVQ